MQKPCNNCRDVAKYIDKLKGDRDVNQISAHTLVYAYKTKTMQNALNGSL